MALLALSAALEAISSAAELSQAAQWALPALSISLSAVVLVGAKLIYWGVLWMAVGVMDHEQVAVRDLAIPLRGILFNGGVAARVMLRMLFWALLGVVLGLTALLIIVMLTNHNAESLTETARLSEVLTQAVAPLIGALVLMAIIMVGVPLVASYRYALIPFIVRNGTLLEPGEIIRLSRQGIRGNRRRLLMLDLSFVGWWALVVVTLGLAAPFVLAYWSSARAVLAKRLLDHAILG